MSNRIKGITVEIGGDTTKLSKALEGVNKNIRNTQTQLKDVEKLLKLDPKNTELLAQKQKLLGDAINETKTKLTTLKTASEQAAKTAGNYDAWKAKYDPLKKKIGETETKLTDLKEQSKKADEQLSKGEISKEKYDALQKEIADTETELKDLKKAAKDVDDEFGKPISPDQYDALQREIIETEQELQNLQREAANSKTALEKIGETGTKLQATGDKISGVGKKLLPVTATVTALGTAAVKTTADFDESMSKVSAVSGAVGEDLEALRAKAREMGATTKFSAADAADALNYMAMAGWKTGDMLDGIEGIMYLAAASGEELGTTSDIVTDALTALGMSADDSAHFADILAAASSNANTNVSMLGESFKYCAPLAGAMDASAEDLSIALGLMANSGIKGSQAGNSLKNALVNMVKPTDKQAAAMERLGIEVSDDSGNMKSLGGIMDMLRKTMGKVNVDLVDSEGNLREYDDIIAELSQTQEGLTQAQQMQDAAIIFGKQNLSGMLAIINATDEDYEKLTNSIYGCEGTAKRMADTMQDNLNGQMTILKSQLQELAISFGDLLMPKIRAIVAKIQEFVDKLNAMSPAQKEAIIKVAALAAAIGPLLIVVGKAMSGIGGLMRLISDMPKIIEGAKAAWAAISGAIGGISAPVIAVVAVIAVLIAAFKHLWDTNEEFRNNITATWEKIKGVFEKLTSGIVDRVNSLGFNFQSFGEMVKAIWDALCQYLAPVFPSYPADANKTRLLMYAVRMNPGATSLTDRDWYDYSEDKNVCGYCQCILGKCKVTDMLMQLTMIKQIMRENNEMIEELTHKVDELQIKVDDLTGDIVKTGMLGDDIYYVMYSDGSVTVRGTGEMYDYHITDNPSPLMKNNEIKSVVISEGITSVGEYVFENNENMTSVSLPSTLRTIGHASFMQGDDYVGVVHGIESIIIPPQVTSIGRSAFWGTAITSLHIPATVTEIGKYAFRDCACLETVRNDSKLIGEFMFVGCSKLTTLHLTSRLERIHGDAFNYCKKLTTIIYDGTVTQWQAVQKASDWACKIGMEVGISGLTTVECSDGHFEYNTESKEWEVFMND